MFSRPAVLPDLQAAAEGPQLFAIGTPPPEPDSEPGLVPEASGQESAAWSAWADAVHAQLAAAAVASGQEAAEASGQAAEASGPEAAASGPEAAEASGPEVSGQEAAEASGQEAAEAAGQETAEEEVWVLSLVDVPEASGQEASGQAAEASGQEASGPAAAVPEASGQEASGQEADDDFVSDSSTLGSEASSWCGTAAHGSAVSASEWVDGSGGLLPFALLPEGPGEAQPPLPPDDPADPLFAYLAGPESGPDLLAAWGPLPPREEWPDAVAARGQGQDMEDFLARASAPPRPGFPAGYVGDIRLRPGFVPPGKGAQGSGKGGKDAKGAKGSGKGGKDGTGGFGSGAWAAYTGGFGAWATYTGGFAPQHPGGKGGLGTFNPHGGKCTKGKGGFGPAPTGGKGGGWCKDGKGGFGPEALAAYAGGFGVGTFNPSGGKCAKGKGGFGPAPPGGKGGCGPAPPGGKGGFGPAPPGGKGGFGPTTKGKGPGPLGFCPPGGFRPGDDWSAVVAHPSGKGDSRGWSDPVAKAAGAARTEERAQGRGGFGAGQQEAWEPMGPRFSMITQLMGALNRNDLKSAADMLPWLTREEASRVAPPGALEGYTCLHIAAHRTSTSLPEASLPAFYAELCLLVAG